jgi:putative hydrolase of the HAD superfamily
MNLTGKTILTFDVVGTLIDFEAGIAAYIKNTGQGAGKTLPDDEILAAFGAAEARQQVMTPEVPFTQMLAPVYALMAQELGLPDEEECAEGFRLSIPHWPAFQDSVLALERLGKRFRLVALTNADNWALGHMAQTLGSPFDDTVTAQDVGFNKPDERVFAFCLERQNAHGYEQKNFIHVAQSQYHDIGVAMALNYTTCWIERRQGDQGSGATPAPETVTVPDYHFATLEAFADAVEDAERNT